MTSLGARCWQICIAWKRKRGGGPWWHCQSGGQTHGERAMQREYDGERGVSSQALKIKPVSSNQLSCSWSVCGNFPDVWVHSGVKATSVAWEEQGWHSPVAFAPAPGRAGSTKCPRNAGARGAGGFQKRGTMPAGCPGRGSISEVDEPRFACLICKALKESSEIKVTTT